MNYMKQVAEMLGVELNEEFEMCNVSKSDTYKITEDGLMNVTRNMLTSNPLMNLINGKGSISKCWKPKINEKYYVPATASDILFNTHMFCGDSFDKNMIERGIVCKTQEEAIELAIKMLRFIKQK